MWRGVLGVHAVCLEGGVNEQGVGMEKGVLGRLHLVKFGVLYVCVCGGRCKEG